MSQPNGDVATETQTSYQYNSAAQTITVGSNQQKSSSVWQNSQTILNAQGMTLVTTNPAGFETSNVYNEFGQLFITTSGNQRTAYQYDQVTGLVTKTYRSSLTAGATVPASLVSTVRYDSAGNEVSLTNSDANTTTWKYDGLGRVTDKYELVATQSRSSTSVAHDNWQYNGLTTTYSDADGNVTTTTIDPVKLTSTEVWNSPGDSTPENSTVTTTDGLGEVTSINEYGSGGTSSAPYSSATFDPDPLGQQTTETQNFSINGIAAPTATLATTRQIQADQGTITTLDLSLGTENFSTTTTTTDVQGRVTQISQDINQNARSLWLQSVPGLDKSVSIKYWATGQRQSLTRTQGSSTTAGYTNYNTNYSASTKTQSNTLYNWQQPNGQPISQFQTTTNVQGQTSSTFNQLYSSSSTASLLSSTNLRYNYDANGQLTSTQQWNGTSWAPVSGTNYNSAGNNTGDIVGAGNRTLYDTSSGATFAYDLDGNVISETFTQAGHVLGSPVTQTTTVFTWDNHGNLISAVTSSSTSGAISETDYFYDGLNRLIGENVTTFGSNPSVTQYGYIYEGSSQLLTINLTSGSANQGRVIQSNFLGNQPGEILAIDMPGQTTGSQPTPAVWLFTDLSGTPTSFGTVNSQGTWQIQQRVMGSTGMVTSTLGDTTSALNQTPVIWNGAQQQTQVSTPTLYDLNGNWYDPTQNRYLTPQSLSATSPNPYTLNGNNPINSGSSVNWSAVEGPDAYSGWFSRGAGETYRQVFGDGFLMSNSWGAEVAVTGGIVASSFVAVISAPVTVPGLLLTGATVGLVDYAGTWAIGATIDTFDNGFGNYQINRFNPALAAQYAATGALTAGVITIGGTALRPVFQPLAGVGQSVWQTIPPAARGVLTQDVGLLFRRATQRSASAGLDLIGDSNDGFLRMIMRRRGTDVDPTGFFDVIAHANENTLAVNGVPTTPAELAQIIFNSPNYSGENIRLLSCLSGYGGNRSYAQALANELGVEVKASPGLLTVYEDGYYVIFNRLRNNDGTWVSLPDKNSTMDWIIFSPQQTR